MYQALLKNLPICRINKQTNVKQKALKTDTAIVDMYCTSTKTQKLQRVSLPANTPTHIGNVAAMSPQEGWVIHSFKLLVLVSQLTNGKGPQVVFSSGKKIWNIENLCLLQLHHGGEPESHS